MWNCPTCNRVFKNLNQWHTCELVTLGNHFKDGISENLKVVFDHLCIKISDWSTFKFEPVKSSILIKKGSTFLSIKVKKTHLEILFFLDYRHDEFPIVTSQQISKNKIIHLVSVSSEDEINAIIPTLYLSFQTYF